MIAMLNLLVPAFPTRENATLLTHLSQRTTMSLIRFQLPLHRSSNPHVSKAHHALSQAQHVPPERRLAVDRTSIRSSAPAQTGVMVSFNMIFALRPMHAWCHRAAILAPLRAQPHLPMEHASREGFAIRASRMITAALISSETVGGLTALYQVGQQPAPARVQ